MSDSIKRNIRLGITISALTVSSIYCINKFIDVTAKRKNMLNSESGRFFEWRYGNIYYTKSGNGSPLLLVHDLLPESSAYEWSKVIKRLEKNHTVYTLDLLGCGRSDKPNLTYTSYMYVQLITDFIRNIIGEPADVVVSGSSASFLIMACNMNYQHFKKIIMINPPELRELNQTPTKRKNMVKFMIDLPLIGTLVYNIEMLQNNIALRMQSRYFFKSHIVPSKLVDTYYESAHLDNSHGKYLLSSIRCCYMNINLAQALKNINNNLYIIESHEQKDALSVASEYAHINPAIETVFISNSKQVPHLEVPERTHKILRVFLESK